MPLPSVLGSVVPLDVAITDENSAPINPSTITCTITLPDDTVETPSPANPSTGTYTVDYLPTLAGMHQVVWTTTGPALALPDVFHVRPALPALIISLAEGKDACSIGQSVTTHDTKLRSLLAAITIAIEDHVGEAIIRRRVTEDIAADWTDEVVLGTTPVRRLVSVTALDGGGSWSVSDLYVDKQTGIVSCLSRAGRLYGLLRWVTDVGYEIVPANYTEAAAIIVQHLWETRRPTQRTPGPGGLQDSMTTTYAGSFGYAIPNRALELLGKAQPRGG